MKVFKFLKLPSSLLGSVWTSSPIRVYLVIWLQYKAWHNNTPLYMIFNIVQFDGWNYTQSISQNTIKACPYCNKLSGRLGQSPNVTLEGFLELPYSKVSLILARKLSTSEMKVKVAELTFRSKFIKLPLRNKQNSWTY